MNFPEKIVELDLPAGGYMIVGSGLLDVLGIRESNDIDILVSEAVSRILKDRGWQVEKRSDGTVRIFDGVYDGMTDWYGKSLEEMLIAACYVDGIPHLNLQDTYKWKMSMNRPKDTQDMKLIEEYLSAHEDATYSRS